MAKKAPKKREAETRANAGLDPVKTETRKGANDPAKSRLPTGKFAPGVSGNPDGREEGSKNTRTLEWEAFGKAIIEGNLPWMLRHIEKKQATDDDGAFQLLMNLLEYFKPKLSRTALTDPDGNALAIRWKNGSDADH